MLCNAHDDMSSFSARSKHQRCYIHKLGCKGPWTTKELLNIATSCALGEEVVRAIFDRLKGKAKQKSSSEDEDLSFNEMDDEKMALFIKRFGKFMVKKGVTPLVFWPKTKTWHFIMCIAKHS